MHKLGERIKKRREFIQIHLGEFASEIGVSASLLSQIENGKAYPSLFTLKKIAEGLKTTVGELIGENEPASDNPVIRHDDKRLARQNDKGCRIFSVSDSVAAPQMDIFIVELSAGSTTGDAMDIHHGQEFLHVLEGQISVLVNDTSYELNCGDSLNIRAIKYREVTSRDNKPSRFIWALTPPLQ